MSLSEEEFDDQEPNAAPRDLVRMRMSIGGEEIAKWEAGPTVTGPIARLAARELSELQHLRRSGPGEWFDYTTDEYLTTEDAARRYMDQFSPGLRARIGSTPEGVREYLAEGSVLLIETQRLLQVRATESRSRHRGRPSEAEEPTRVTVEQLATNLAMKIRSALAQNSRISQQHDKTFPLRLLSSEASEIEVEDEVVIRERYADQADLRRRLADIGVLDQSPELPLPDRELETWQRRVMSIYLADSRVKLNTFENLLRKVSFLREVVNARFLYKRMMVDSDRGFYFVTDHGLELSPAQLSSGEQHEVVLLYRLLFDVPAGSVVLLDEPEISLHIAWQKKVLDDLQAISEISDLQFVVATHSPSIVGEWSERMVLLAPSEDG